MTIVEAGAADWFNVKGEESVPKSKKRRKEGTIGLVIGLAMIISMLIAGFVVPLISPYGPDELVAFPFLPPSPEHFFGTDQLGRDIFTRVFTAVFLDLGVAFLGVAIPLCIGTVIGIGLGVSTSRAINGFTGSLIDGINAFPLLVLVIALIAILGPGLGTVIIALALTNWARYARISRTKAVVVKQQGYIEAAQTLGYSKPRILLRHLVPNVSSESIAYALSDIILVILLIAGLSFLGLGAQPPTPEWGAMISEGRSSLEIAPWMVLFPGAALCWAGVSFSFISEGLIGREKDVKS